MRFIKRWCRRLLVAAVLLAIVAVAFELVVLPYVARRQVLATLRQIDPAVRLGHLEVSPWHLGIDQVALGRTSWMKANDVELTYRPLELLRGRVDSVRIGDVQWRVAVHDGEIDLGFPAPAGEDDAALPADLLDRFERIDVPKATITVSHDAGDTRLPVGLSLAREGAEARLIVRSGAVNVAADEGRTNLQNVVLSLDSLVDRHLRPGATIGSIRADRVDVAGTTLRDVVVDLERADVDAPIRVQGQAGGEAIRELGLSGTLELPAAFPRAGAWTVAADVEASLAMTPALLAPAVDRGIRVDGDGPVAVAGRLEAILGGPPDATGRSGWRVQSRGVHAAFDGWTITHARSGSGGAGVAGRLDLELTLDAGAFELHVMPASSVSAERLFAPRDARVAMTSADALLAMGEPGGRFVRAADATWRAEAPVAVRLRADAVTATVPAVGDVDAGRIAAEFPLRLSADAAGLVVDAAAPGRITMTNLLAAESTVTAGIAEAFVETLNGSPLMRIAGGMTDVAAVWRVRMTDDVSFDRPEAIGRLTGVELSGTTRRQSGEDANNRMTLVVADGHARLPAADVALAGIRLELPIGDGDDGSFSVATITRAGRALGHAEGRVSAGGDGLVASATLDLPGGARLEARGQLAGLGDGTGLGGHVHVEAAPFSVVDDVAFARVLGLGPGASVGGLWSLTADVPLGPEAGNANVRVTVEGGRLLLPDQELEAAAIQGAVTLHRLDPVETAGAQRVTIGAGRFGSLAFRSGSADVRLDGPGELCIESAEVVLEDGTLVTTSPFCVDPAAAEIQTTLVIEHMSLAYWLPLLTRGKATGEGTLSGRIPVRYRLHGASRLALGEGRLHASAAGGWIRIAEVDQLTTLLEQSDPRFRTDENLRVVKQRLVDALRDYAYDTLRFDLVPEPDGLMLSILTKGRGRQGPTPQEIGSLTVNVHDIDRVLSRLISFRSAMEQDADRALERFFDD